jgi:hypothetical protein
VKQAASLTVVGSLVITFSAKSFQGKGDSTEFLIPKQQVAKKCDPINSAPMIFALVHKTTIF